jgi:hypothetical protein
LVLEYLVQALQAALMFLLVLGPLALAVTCRCHLEARLEKVSLAASSTWLVVERHLGRVAQLLCHLDQGVLAVVAAISRLALEATATLPAQLTSLRAHL